MSQVFKLRDFSSPEDETISSSVRALISGRGLLAEFVAYEIGMPKATLYNKLRGQTPWKASEVARVSRFFGVRVGDLYEGLGGQFGPRPDDGAAASSVSSGWAPSDSNRQPADYKMAGPAIILPFTRPARAAASDTVITRRRAS